MPFVVTQEMTWANAVLDSMLEALTTRPAGALLTTPTVHLFTAGPQPISGTSVPGDFTEATFSGYAAVTLSGFLGPINLPSNDGRGVHQEADFLAGAGAGPPGQSILGYWLDNGSTTFYGGETFQTPVQIVNPGDFLSLDVVFPINNPASAN